MMTNWILEIDKAWKDNELRKEFERELLLRPLAETHEEQTLDQLSGYYTKYTIAFEKWVTAKFDLEEHVPESFRQRWNKIGEVAESIL